MEVYNIAIVDKSSDSAQKLVDFLNHFSKENGVEFNIEVYLEAVTFLDDYKPWLDMVIMDVDLPFMDGIKAGHKLREMDSRISITFITNLKQYAIEGYSVNALDFLLKPITYQRFETLIKKAIPVFIASKSRYILVSCLGGIKCVDSTDILYVEVRTHQILYYLNSGETITTWGNLSEVKNNLPDGAFKKCNKSCLVNLRNVRRIDGNEVTVGNKKLHLPRSQKNRFMEALTEYLSFVRASAQ